MVLAHELRRSGRTYQTPSDTSNLPPIDPVPGPRILRIDHELRDKYVDRPHNRFVPSKSIGAHRSTTRFDEFGRQGPGRKDEGCIRQRRRSRRDRELRVLSRRVSQNEKRFVDRRSTTKGKMTQQNADGVVSRVTAIGKEARLSWLLAWLAGMIGAVAFVHSAGYFVTFMTGNTERAVLSWYPIAYKQQIRGAGPVAALLLILSFLVGVIVASYCRRRFWRNHPHGATVLTTFGLLIAGTIDMMREGFGNKDVDIVSILIMAFSIGALNTSFTKNGEVSIPLSYVTGTVVKLGQGIERHVFGKGTVYDWLGYALLYSSFLFGAATGGVLGMRVTGPQITLAAGALCGLTTIVTFFHTDRQTILG